MDENELVAPVETPDTQDTATQAATETQSEPAPEEIKEPAAKEEIKPKREPWHQKRIDELTKARREAERENAALRAMLESRNTDTKTSPVMSDDVITSRANEIVKVQRLNDAANALANTGKTAYPDFNEAVSGIAQVADLSQRPDFLEAVTDLPNGHDVFYMLGKDPDEAAHILSLPPVKMALELAKLSAKAARPNKVITSNAPKPITPITKTSTSSAEISDDLPMAEWLKRRSETARTRY